ncbi:GNAT family N-acetyltransferase [Arcanobacterium ihumii]|uniref:GNAT family N-acetyltransferase n=1 Tax=Arcanobacterium ihumii TaxID=2138162 RepID=UPI000F5468F5|nr:GNAT family N-acetyltransferase [Arcanobacterium ihumii]
MMLKAIEVSTEAELLRCFEIRLEVFVHEQNVPEEEELDHLDRDPKTVHILISDGEKDYATARILPDHNGEVHVGRVAVRKNARRLGVGRLLMETAHSIALAKFADNDGKVRSVLSAQLQAVPFYQALGYREIDDRIYLDAGIKHRDMEWLS